MAIHQRGLRVLGVANTKLGKNKEGRVLGNFCRIEE